MINYKIKIELIIFKIRNLRFYEIKINKVKQSYLKICNILMNKIKINNKKITIQLKIKKNWIMSWIKYMEIVGSIMKKVKENLVILNNQD